MLPMPASLLPRLCPADVLRYPLEAADDIVLVLLGGNGFDMLE